MHFSYVVHYCFIHLWYWEHVQPYSHHGLSYSAIPPPLMARWGEHRAAQRDAVYSTDQLDGGEVHMSIKNFFFCLTSYIRMPYISPHLQGYQGPFCSDLSTK